MNENELAEITSSPAEEQQEVSPAETPEPSQEKDPVAEELDRVKRKPKRTKLEQLEYTKKRVEEQLAEERKKAGITEDEDENRPVTVAELKRLRQEEAIETAQAYADDIEDEKVRELTKFHLENTIKPSGDAETDYRNARALVEAVKHKEIAEILATSRAPKKAAAAPSAPPREKRSDDLTKEEMEIMANFKMTKEQVLAAREQ